MSLLRAADHARHALWSAACWWWCPPAYLVSRRIHARHRKPSARTIWTIYDEPVDVARLLGLTTLLLLGHFSCSIGDSLRPDRRQHASGRFFSAPQCLLERLRDGVVGCDQFVAFGGWIGEADSWARLAVVSALCAHVSPTPTVGAELRSLRG